MANDFKAHFDEHGYAIARGAITGERLRGIQEDFDRIVAQLVASQEGINAKWSGPGMDAEDVKDTVVLHTHNVQQYSARWLAMMQSEEFLAPTRALLGDDVILHHSKLFQKPAENGAPFPMHQDWDYFPTVKDTMLAAIVHLSRADDEMGCFRVYPGSHKLGRIDQSGGQHENEVLARYPLEGSTPLEAEPGDVVFFHYLLIHGSKPNRSQEVRKTVLVQMHSGDDRVEDGVRHPNERLVLSGWNHYASRGSVNE